MTVRKKVTVTFFQVAYNARYMLPKKVTVIFFGTKNDGQFFYLPRGCSR